MISFEHDDTVYKICFVSRSWNINNELREDEVYSWHGRTFYSWWYHKIKYSIQVNYFYFVFS